MVDVPERIMAQFGGRRRVPISGTVNSTKFQTTIATMNGHTFIGFRKEYRDAAKLEPGQTVTITIEEEVGIRTLTTPKQLSTALRAASLLEVFDGLSYTHRKELIRSVEDAAKPATRERRIVAAVEQVRERSLLRGGKRLAGERGERGERGATGEIAPRSGAHRPGSSGKPGPSRGPSAGATAGKQGYGTRAGKKSVKKPGKKR